MSIRRQFMMPCIVDGANGVKVDKLAGAYIFSLSHPLGFNVEEYDADPTGNTSSTSAFIAAIAAANAAGGGVVIAGPGTFIVGGSSITLPNNVSIVGAGKGATTLKLTSSFTSYVISASSKSFIGVSDLTIDLNELNSGASSGAINFTACSDWFMDRISIQKIGTFGLIWNGGDRFRIKDCDISKTTPAATQNQGILGAASLASSYGEIVGNVLTNTGMDACCAYSSINDNKITGWKFGAGITTEQNAFCHDLLIAGNVCKGGVGTDVNGYTVGGIENWAPYSRIVGNTCASNAGTGFDCGGHDSVISDNLIYDNSTSGSNFSGISARYADASNNARGCLFNNNRCFDTLGAGGTQAYGYIEQSASLTGIILDGNNFQGNKTGDVSILSSSTRVGVASTNVQRIAAGETVLDGGNPTPVTTGLTTIISCSLAIKSTSAPGVGTSVVTYGTSGGTLNLYGWKPTGAGDTTLIASTGTETIGWQCVGT